MGSGVVVQMEVVQTMSKPVKPDPASRVQVQAQEPMQDALMTRAQRERLRRPL
jgi:hypothetical protein